MRPTRPIPPLDPATHERFWSHAEIGADDQCWPWLGLLDTWGYGRFNWLGKGWRAPRIAYRSANGPIPEGLQVDHLCRARHCVNPRHLEAVTPQINTLRSSSHVALNAVKTHCHRGHPFTPENTAATSDGRACRTCMRIHAADYRARRRAMVAAQQLSCEGRRHVFAHYGYVGSSGRFCRRCGAENPWYDESRDPTLTEATP